MEGFLEDVRNMCAEQNILLLFDEVVTGFRLAYGGAQEYYGVILDFVAYRKSFRRWLTDRRIWWPDRYYGVGQRTSDRRRKLRMDGIYIAVQSSLNSSRKCCLIRVPPTRHL